MSKLNTIHTARTLMFAELEKVMAYSIDNGLYLDAMGENVFGKKSSDGINQTKRFLKKLYCFESENPYFIVLEYFWKITNTQEKPLIAFLFAINRDNLLAESLDVIQQVKPGEKAAIEFFEEIIEKYHPGQYSPKTRKSAAQNIASSWKQAGFIEGKVKNIRIVPEITYKVTCFAFLLSYLNGDRGDFLLNNMVIKSLCLPESKLRELAIECAKKDLMQYQYAGSVTAINFTNLLNKIGINGNTY